VKYCIVVPDGMADVPVAELDGQTPLEAAETPHMDFISCQGRTGQVWLTPEGLRPDSDVALLSVMGYDPRKFPPSRAPLEALGIGLELDATRVYFRCNLVTLDDDVMADHSGGHIADREARVLIALLNEQAAPEGVAFHAGRGYRCLMSCPRDMAEGVETVPPQDILGEPVTEHLPRGERAEWLRRLIARSYELIAPHEINRVRADLGENPVNAVWPWGQGGPVWLPPFREEYRKEAAVITAIPLVRGLGRAAGWDVPDVPGATGYYDTDYRAKADAALARLEDHDLVLVHIEATDEAGHEGNIKQKVRCIEQVDALIVGPLLEAFRAEGDGRLLVLPDHETRVEERRHTAAPVPFAIFGPRISSVLDLPFSERAAAEADLKVRRGHELMAFLLRP